MNTAQVDLEYGIVGDLVTSRTFEILEYATKVGLKADFFTDNTTRRAFEKIVELKSDDNVYLRSELTTLFGVEAVMKAIECAKVDADVGGAYARRIDKLVKEGRIKEMQSKLSEVNQLQANGRMSVEYFAAEMMRVLQPYAQATNGSAVIKPMKLSDLGLRVPEEENPRALFEGGWMRKGQAICLVSVSGSGKSVITMQLCYAWARGREMFGIKPLKPLKIAVFQTEDDDDELRFFRDAMSYRYTHEYGWTDEDIEKAVQNIDFFPVLGIMGDDFVKYFREIQSKYNYDLVIINPLQGVADFDLANNAQAKDWCTKKIDPIIKDSAKPCGLLVIHHTPKMHSDNSRTPHGGMDPFAQYTGAGASVLYNWFRGSLLILPYKKDGVSGYQFVAAKRGERLKRWENRPGYAYPTKFICHSNNPDRPFWSEMSAPESAQTAAEKAEIAEKAKADVLENDVKLLIAKITQPMSATVVREHARLLFKKTRGDAVYKHFTEHLADYGFMERKGEGLTGKLFGTMDMFLKA